MKKTLFLLALLAVFAGGRAQVPVIITAGQSNTDGRVTEELPGYIRENGYKHCRWCYGSYDKIQTDGFEPFWPRTAHVKHPKSWAYDAVFYYLLEQELKRDFYVVKFSLGGTAIDPGNPSSTNGLYWSADKEWLAQTSSTLTGGRSLLLSFVEEIDRCIDSQLSQLPQGFEIKAFLWHQGESDKQMGTRYHDNLKGVVEYVRRHHVEKTGNKNYSKLPFICGTVARSNRDYNPEIESALWQLSREMENFFVIDMKDGELQSDRLHFTAKSAEYLGREMFKAYKQASAPKAANCVNVGIDRHDFFYTGQSKSRYVYKIKGGKKVWEFTDPEARGEISDMIPMSDGNMLIAHQHGLKEINAKGETVWVMDAPKGCEIHTAQPIGQNRVLFIQNGDPL